MLKKINQLARLMATMILRIKNGWKDSHFIPLIILKTNTQLSNKNFHGVLALISILLLGSITCLRFGVNI